MNPSFCFVAGTAVLTTLGKKAIEDIRVGDKIPCVDHITGEESEKRVVATSVNKTDKLVELEIGGEIIRCTETHPFQVKDRGWVDAAELVPGDLVYRKNWQISPVQHVTLVTFDEPVAVYNFEVEDFHTYFVGCSEWLVHNSCNHTSKWNAERRRYWRAKGKTVNVNSDQGTYKATIDNLNRMKKGLAPKGPDGHSVILHHPEGIVNNFGNYIEMTRTDHIVWHQLNGWFR